jgi:hypothetical protein
MSFSALLALFALFGLAAATPSVTLIFGPSDQAVLIAAAIIAVAFAIFGKLVHWGTYGAGHLMSHEDHDMLRDKIRGYGCGFFALPGWVLGLIKTIGYIALAIALGGFVLHVFEDAGGVNIADPPPFLTWYTVIWVITLGAAILDKMAADFHHENSWTFLAAIISVISWAAFIASLIFIILELVQLPTGTQVQWETFLLIVVAVWILVSTYFTIRYGLAAYLGNPRADKDM